MYVVHIVSCLVNTGPSSEMPKKTGAQKRKVKARRDAELDEKRLKLKSIASLFAR